MRQALAVLLLVLLATLAVAQESSPTYTLEDFLQTPTLGRVNVSPDGKLVAWTESRRDIGLDKRVTQLWLSDKDGKNPRRLTWENERVGGLSWRPDGALCFLRSFDEKTQLFINPLDGSEPRPVTDFAEGVQGYWWSPDGQWLAVLAPAAEEEVDEEEEEEEDDKADWTVYDRLEQPEDYPQLWIVPAGNLSSCVGDREARQLSEPPYNVQHVAWSPDGTTLAVTYNPLFSGLVDEEQKVALVHVKSGEWSFISDPDRHSSQASFSPDSKQVAYFTDREDDFRAYLNLKDLVIYDRATEATQVVSPGHQLALGGTGSTPGHAPVWSKNGKDLYIDASRGTTYDLYKVTPGKREFAPVTALEGNLGSWSIHGETLAYVESALHLPGTLYSRPIGKDKVKELATVNDHVADFNLRPARHMQLPGKDGTIVEGFLFLPPGAEDNENLPAVIEMHGGPFYRYGNAWTTRYPWQVLSHEGFAVFIANPRGGTAYGEEFLRGVYRNFGTDDFDDLMLAVDALAERGTIDPDRLGFTGYSYGGLMTNVVISRTDRFKCAVSIAGIFNYTSAIGQNNPQLFIDSYRQPWAGDLQRMWEHSPASRADQITTPTLVMHGEEDEPVDPRQSIELFSYLQLNGVPSRLVLYPDEGHGINRPSHMVDYETRELEWFRHYLLGDENAAGAEAPVPVEPTVR